MGQNGSQNQRVYTTQDKLGVPILATSIAIKGGIRGIFTYFMDKNL